MGNGLWFWDYSLERTPLWQWEYSPPMFDGLRKVTRRAFIPNLFAQLYLGSPQTEFMMRYGDA